MLSQIFFLACVLVAPECAFALHGAHANLQLPGSVELVGKASPPLPSPVSVPAPDSLAATNEWDRPQRQQELEPSAAKASSLLVLPRVAASSQDQVGIALPELKLQRFGHKYDDYDEASMSAAAAIAKPNGGSSNGASSFFQMDSEQGLEAGSSSAVPPASDQEVFMQRDVTSLHSSGSLEDGSNNGAVPPVAPARQVGEVVADAPATAQDNGTVLDLSQGVGFVAAAKPPPALSEVLPLPFMPDGLPPPGRHIHVDASIATQDVGVDGSQSVKAPLPLPAVGLRNEPGAAIMGSTSKKNVSLEDQDEAWSNFTAAEALTEGNRGHSHDTEALATDNSAVTSPSSLNEPGAAIVKDAAAGKTYSPPLATPHSTSEPAAGIFGRRSVLSAISTFALVGGLCLACVGAGFLASFVWQRRSHGPTMRSQVEELRICLASEVERRLPRSGGYDCAFSRPLSSCQLLRVEARIEGPAAGNVSLSAPLTGQACVLFSVAVSRQLHDGIRPAPVAFASGSVDFVITLKDAPNVRINLHADEVSLFDMCHGKHVQRQAFAASPDKWQDFILTHRAGTEWQTSTQMRSDSSCLEFQECALLCGTTATFVGELHRNADGTLSLRPLQNDSLSGDVSNKPEVCARGTALSERWRTSWECSGSEASNVASQAPTPRETGFAKVLASDDPVLLDGASLLTAAASILRRCSAKYSSRAITFMSQYRGGKNARSEKCLGGLEGRSS